MAHFYFNTNDGDTEHVDDVGMGLSGLEEARLQALEALPDMARDKLLDGDQRTLSVTVLDDGGHVVYRASLSLQGEWVK